MSYLTPDATANASYVCMRLFIREELSKFIYGLITELTIAENWEEFGNMTIEECVNLANKSSASLGICRPTVGDVIMSCHNETDEYTVRCRGQLVQYGTYPQLEAVLPANSPMREANGIRIPSFLGRYPIGGNISAPAHSVGGERYVTLTEDNLPPHSHDYNGVLDVVSLEGAGVPVVTAVSGPTQQTGLTGNAERFEIRPPYYSIFFKLVVAE